jgi:PKD repeat protein
MYMNKGIFFTVVTIFAMLSGACTISETPAPPLVGPSEFALSLALAARPDTVSEDGASQSVITIVARDANGQPIRDLQLRVDIIDAVTGKIVTDRGTLSASSRTTDSSGTTSVVFTAPMSPAPGVDDPLNRNPILIRVTPVGTNSDTLTAQRFVTIRLVPTQIVVVPGAPVPSFTYSPANPAVGVLVLFNAAASFDPDGTIVSYRWDWGDGESVTKPTATEDHDFPAPGTYNVKLTVTDDAGLQSVLIRPIVVN